MANVVVVGAQWGDEGKAKITDLLAEAADVVVRCQGGCNAGHTVKRGADVFKFHLIPSGLLYPDKLCIVGPGTVIDPAVLLREVEDMAQRGYPVSGLKVSSRAHVTLPLHVALDKAQEAHLAERKIGTTGRGIGPTYMDKVGRFGLRLGDLLEPDAILRERLLQIAALKAPWIDRTFDVPETRIQALADELLAFCRQYREPLRPFITDTLPLLHDAARSGKNLLFEGAQGTLLDVDFGTYPFVTSSNATAGGACTGSGLGPTRLDHVVGVMKAYITRVGEGPFPTELTDTIGRQLVEVGQEFGTTTGRMRRCGWFDAVIGRYGVQVNGLDSVAVTKLDVLDELPEIKICTAYRHGETGEILTHFPEQITVLQNVTPVYETLPGWQSDTSHVRDYDELPANARHYLARIAELLETRISIVSVGPERDQTILREHPVLAAGKSQVETAPSVLV